MAGWKREHFKILISICRVVCPVEVGFFMASVDEKIRVGRGSNMDKVLDLLMSL